MPFNTVNVNVASFKPREAGMEKSITTIRGRAR